MLIPMIPVKTLAKMLLILMMGPTDKPLSIPTLLDLTNGYYELRVPDTDKRIFFSKAQLQNILNALPSELRFSMGERDIDLNKMAAYIISNNLSSMGSDQPPRLYDDRSSASSGPRNTFIFGASIRVKEPEHNHNMVSYERTISSNTIAEHTREKNIHELRHEQVDLLRISRMPCKDQDTKKEVDTLLLQVDTSLIFLGYLTTQKLRDHRELLKRGKINALKARLENVEKLLARGWLFQVTNGGNRSLRLEQYYLETITTDPLIQEFHNVTEGSVSEARAGINELRRLWRSLNAEQRAEYENFLGFSPIPQADFLISKRPDHAQIQMVTISPEVLASVLTDRNVNLMTLPVQDQILESLEKAQNVHVLHEKMATLANQVFSHYRSLGIYNPAVEDLVNESLQIIKTTNNLNTMISHIVMVNHILSDLQDIVQQRPSLIERSPGIIARGVRTFALQCNPAGRLITTTEFWVSTFHFVSDVTLGRLYLTPEDYQKRIDNFSDGLSKLSPSTLAQLDADGWMQVLAITSADLCCANIGLQGTIKYLQTLPKIGKTGQAALAFTEKLRQGVDTVLAKNPLVIFKRNATIRLANGVDEIKGTIIEVINSARMLLQSECARLLAELEHEIAVLKPIFDGTRKGFGTFANKTVKINYEHILGMNPRFNDKGGVSGMGGFHHDFMGAIEQSGLVKLVNKVIDKTGVYSATIIVNGTEIPSKTFFPIAWSRKQVMAAIFEAYDNFKKSGIEPVLRHDLKYKIRGITKEGIEIEMYITQNMLITSAYPILPS